MPAPALVSRLAGDRRMRSQKTSQCRQWLHRISCRKAFILLFVLVMLLDQLSKLWVREALPLYASAPEEGFLRISHVINTGMLLGIEAPFAVGLLLPLGILGTVLFLSWRYFPLNSRVLDVAMGFFVGGCVGNLADRLLLGGVTDIIDVNLSASIGRLVFNVADLACLAGIAMFDVYLIRLRLKRIPRQQGLLSYFWTSFVAVERSRSQEGQWWKPAFLRPESKAPAFETTSGPG